MRGSFHGIGRVKQGGGDGIECDECMLVIRDGVTAFLPFKRTVWSRQEKQCFFPDEILARVYRALTSFFLRGSLVG